MKPLLVNEEIRDRELMLIDASGKSLGVVSFDQAMWLAWEAGLDLVLVGPNAHPPVARLLDYGKYQYEQAKAAAKSKAHTSEVKEIRLSLKIGAHDFEVKRAQADRWLSEGNRVRVTVKLFGREQTFPEQARDLVERMRTALGASYEMPLTKVGNRWTTIIGRKKK